LAEEEVVPLPLPPVERKVEGMLKSVSKSSEDDPGFLLNALVTLLLVLPNPKSLFKSLVKSLEKSLLMEASGMEA
jgi:hypothetical protein